MKKSIYLVMVLFTSLTHAQQVSMSVTDQFKLPENADALRLGNFYYVADLDYSGAQMAYTATLKAFSHSLEFYKYDLNMKEIKDVKVEDGKKNFGPFSSRLVSFANKLLLLHWRYNDDTVRLFLSEVDPETLSLTRPKELFVVFQRGSVNPIGLNKSLNSTFTSETPDGNKLLIAYANDKQAFSCIIDKDLQVSRSSVLATPARYFSLEEVFVDNKENKFFSYGSGDKEFMGDILSAQRGVLMENNSGKKLFQPFTPGASTVTVLHFKNSLDNSKVYVYANYAGKHQMEGVVLATLDPSNLTMSAPRQISYSQDVREKLYKLSFADKTKDGISVYETDYELVDNGQGTIAFIGQCSYVVSGTFTNGRGYNVENTGPVIGVFLHGEDINFTLIPRKEIMSVKAQVTAVVHDKKIICIYTDNERYVNDETIENKKKSSLKTVFAAAIFDNDGFITKQIQLTDYPTGNKKIPLGAKQKITGDHFVIPVYITTVGMTRYKTFQVQWVELTLN